jgi:hypothetical protein
MHILIMIQGIETYLPDVTFPSKKIDLCKLIAPVRLHLRGGSPMNLCPDLLPEHPGLVKGELPNGMKYVILPNHMPKNRFYANLLVRILRG